MKKNSSDVDELKIFFFFGKISEAFFSLENI